MCLNSKARGDVQDLGVLDAIIRGQSSEEMSETQDQDVQPGTITSMNVTTQPQLASSTKGLLCSSLMCCILSYC